MTEAVIRVAGLGKSYLTAAGLFPALFLYSVGSRRVRGRYGTRRVGTSRP